MSNQDLRQYGIHPPPPNRGLAFLSNQAAQSAKALKRQREEGEEEAARLKAEADRKLEELMRGVFTVAKKPEGNKRRLEKRERPAPRRPEHFRDGQNEEEMTDVMQGGFHSFDGQNRWSDDANENITVDQVPAAVQPKDVEMVVGGGKKTPMDAEPTAQPVEAKRTESQFGGNPWSTSACGTWWGSNEHPPLCNGFCGRNHDQPYGVPILVGMHAEARKKHPQIELAAKLYTEGKYFDPRSEGIPEPQADGSTLVERRKAIPRSQRRAPAAQEGKSAEKAEAERQPRRKAKEPCEYYWFGRQGCRFDRECRNSHTEIKPEWEQDLYRRYEAGQMTNYQMTAFGTWARSKAGRRRPEASKAAW